MEGSEGRQVGQGVAVRLHGGAIGRSEAVHGLIKICPSAPTADKAEGRTWAIWAYSAESPKHPTEQ